MKTCSVTDDTRPPDRHAAWACTLANLLALPGLGSLSVGRRVGWPQAALALLGFGLTVGGLLRTLLDWVSNPDLVIEPTPALFAGLAGLTLSAAAWFWALATSIQVHRQARRHEHTATPAAATPPVLPD